MIRRVRRDLRRLDSRRGRTARRAAARLRAVLARHRLDAAAGASLDLVERMTSR